MPAGDLALRLQRRGDVSPFRSHLRLISNPDAPALARALELHRARPNVRAVSVGNRERDRRRKGSANRRRTVARLGRLHRAIRGARQNFLQKSTTKLVRRYAGFAVEDLSLKGLIRTRLAKSFADAGLGELLRQLA